MGGQERCCKVVPLGSAPSDAWDGPGRPVGALYRQGLGIGTTKDKGRATVTIGAAFVWHLDSEGLRSYRESHGLSRPQMAEAVGLHAKTIAAFESRRSSRIAENTAEKLGRVVPHLIEADHASLVASDVR